MLVHPSFVCGFFLRVRYYGTFTVAAFLGVFLFHAAFISLSELVLVTLLTDQPNPRRGLIFVQSGVVVWVLVCSTERQVGTYLRCSCIGWGECTLFVVCMLYIYLQKLFCVITEYVVPLG